MNVLEMSTIGTTSTQHPFRRVVFLLTTFVVLLMAGVVTAAAPTAYSNIVVNGDFSASFSGWSNSTSTWDVDANGVMNANGGFIYQIPAFTAATNDPYTFTLKVGNTASASRSLSLLLYSSSGGNIVSCTWSIPARSPLTTYRMSAKAPGAWSPGIVVNITPDALAGIQVDDVNVQYVPGSQVSTTVCTAPTPTPTATFTPTHTPTATASATSTPTATFTPTPNFFVDSTTPDGEPARISRQFSIIDYFSLLVLFAILVSIWINALLARLKGGKKAE